MLHFAHSKQSSKDWHLTSTIKLPSILSNMMIGTDSREIKEGAIDYVKQHALSSVECWFY